MADAKPPWRERVQPAVETFPIPLTLEPMEAEPVTELPDGPGWAFEPKYDGFRCLIFREDDAVALMSRRQRPLDRFFPEMHTAVAAMGVRRFVLDGELIIPGGTFEMLQMRLHPAASRIAKLSREAPSGFVAFDLLSDETGHQLRGSEFAKRRAALQHLIAAFGDQRAITLSPQTRSIEDARAWLAKVGHGLDGIVCKRLDLPYQPGQRAMLKYKLWHTIDAVIAGAYCALGTYHIEYLLLGLYNPHGKLDYVGRCGVNDPDIDECLQPLMGRGGFTGDAPGGPSRWSRKERVVTPIEPRLAVEVSADHITGGKFRHGSRFVRWRDDKNPRQCTTDQLNADAPVPSRHQQL